MEETLPVFGCFQIFNPSSFLSEDCPGFLNHSQREIKKIGAYYQKDETKIIEQYQNKLMAEWQKFKYGMLSWKKDIPKDILTCAKGEKKQPTNTKK